MIKAVSFLMTEALKVAFYVMMQPTAAEIRKIFVEELAKVTVIIIPDAPDDELLAAVDKAERRDR